MTDLMRYASLAQGVEFLSSFGGFIPSGEEKFSKLPPPETQERFSDEQLYALALYIYSLQPPPNPNRLDTIAQAGLKVFEREGCAGCHTPPHYTNNKLLPVRGFRVPPEHLSKYDILNVPIETDPRLTLQTRRGTGYYKVPSLRGVWYRSAFEHNGSVATLEDWFDGSRLRNCDVADQLSRSNVASLRITFSIEYPISNCPAKVGAASLFGRLPSNGSIESAPAIRTGRAQKHSGAASLPIEI